ncbi:hypothetical protein TH3_03340 [Thalassospira xiamenensis M-5 = DSM 17429]|uniref:Uncharacterized protein n=1 Tax=Thalassospira xiamenensis M-5 = DSM 17429 TaxID=1123366 RepID=A0AB72U9J7_9PROT|nr:hypothetical protein TH3_03340 [Thalassospira xiamenensis M-5 = DSM 17429]
MDSGSALRFARNDGFDPSPNQSSQPTNPGPLTKPSQPDRHSRDGGNPVSFNGAWIPGLRSASPGMTIVINRQANPATPATRQPGNPATRPDDPVPIQSGRNSGPLILGIVTLQRPDWTELDRTNFVPAIAAPNKRPCPKGTFLPS